ncbi:U3 small nucleolar RNA-associated protein 14 homolog A-like isoform X1 [Hydractinia symbiolongicarpus]|uniref:U3 small nucleolar RNA-associated protein 14 homolog A-like isoform X1 n=1 Tax=Hydractinia symbiolongicarpus TaxID=13093 RepID=UPI00254AA862|nr:U3 small nucleolar RNA-associated protein 14 homolog A-like isoform X1 [Hydractinia symbiolongicarpus]
MVLSENAMDDVELSSDDSSNEETDQKAKKRRHRKLLKDIGVTIGKKRKSTRNEPGKEVSEYGWSNSHDANKLELHELVGSLSSTAQPIAKIKKKLRKMENTTKVLEKPLSKPETQRVERTVAYKDTARELEKWNPIIQKNREAEQLVFPLNQYKPPPVSTKTLVTNFKPQNDLEREISAVLQGSKHLLERKDKELTEDEEKALKAFDLQDALERRKELQKTRALQSYYEAKCRRMKKIKSKKYHRILKKEQQKVMEKVDLETLSKENPELFQSELEKAEKLRALERANLRHRNTSKWAKNLITKGRKTKQEQEVVREQLRLSRQLTEHKTIDDNDSEGSDNEGTAENNTTSEINLLTNKLGEDNPWLLGSSKQNQDNEEEKVESTTKYKKLNAVVTKESKQFQEEQSEEEDKSSGEEWDKTEDEQPKKKKTVRKKKKKKNTSSKNTQDSDDVIEFLTEESKVKTKLREKQTNKRPTKEADTLRFLRQDKDVIELNTQEESSDDDDIVYDTEQRMNIREAFANDDVIGDFVQEKSDLVESSKPKPADLTLPGWGEWAGAGLVVSSKKKKKFTKPSGPAPKRKDDTMSNVIINETRNEKLARHQVSEVPFPYSNKTEFERSIRQPIGEHWNTPSVYGKLTEPRIRTTPGTVIDPLKPGRKLKKKLKKH